MRVDSLKPLWRRGTGLLFSGAVVGLFVALSGSVGLGVASTGSSAATAPTNTALPTVIGQAKQGATTAASTGVWSGTTPLAFSYQWQRCDSGGGACVDIVTAIDETHRVALGDVGRTLRVVVVATNTSGSESAVSETSAKVMSAAPGDPVNTQPPRLTGTVKLGSSLRAQYGAWQGWPLHFRYQWQRCDATGAACSPIAGATRRDYTLMSADSGKTVRCVLTAINSSGQNTAVTPKSAVIAAVSPPVNTREPQISGTAQAGSTLTVTSGTWNGSPSSYHYQWMRCPSSGGAGDASNCAAISGATTGSYAPGSADVGHRLRVRVTATNATGSKTVASNATATIKAASSAAAPANTREPQISGTAQAGSTLTVTSGTWNGSPSSYHYQWMRCPSSGGAGDASNCAAISGATTGSYAPGSADVGHRLRVRVTATNATGSKTVASNATATVKAATEQPPPVTNGCAKQGGTVPVSGISAPARLLIDQAQVNPSTITYGTRSLTVRFHVSACGGSVEGALVYAAAVPYGMFANTNEQTTGSDGWATLQITALAGFPVSNKQQVLVMFVRARKAGENLLGGISTRRLISFHVTHG